uniref:Uncharacterized protein AlNc14C249G9619 n=1 Tax=Albugo laibachii Nc14 TaxID=890382 RepID=F0WTE0_9STRA|nr:conserved hypothetical protein [Albugo laibachii Nc14]|eukprot:CCA24630.1 conserved hypothetical protein [Albugo laibachii Nc14]
MATSGCAQDGNQAEYNEVVDIAEAHHTASTSMLNEFTQTIAHEVDHATSKWLKLFSSTFLGANSVAANDETDQQSSSSHKNTHENAAQEAMQTYKIALVGGPAVGKSSIVRRWKGQAYPTKYRKTIGIEISSKIFNLQNGQSVQLMFWDISSAEVEENEYSALHSHICNQLDGIFFVVNIERLSSIAAIDRWRYALSKYISATEIPFYLLCHKADLIHNRVMSTEDIAVYAKAAGYRGWLWTVGCPTFGENDRRPAVMEALESMVEDVQSHRKCSRAKEIRSLFESTDPFSPLEVIHVDENFNAFSSSVVKNATKAITTVARDRRDYVDEAGDQITERLPRMGSSWMLGREKEIYWHPTSESILTRYGSDDDESIDSNDYAFPFANLDSIHADPKSHPSSPEEPEENTRGYNSSASAPAGAGTPELTEDAAWQFFGGSISRQQAERILHGHENGTFLLRRKDERTLILSYLESCETHHALIEYANKQYHVGSSKSSQVSFNTLAKCIRSVRKYAYRGLVFSKCSGAHRNMQEYQLLPKAHADDDPDPISEERENLKRHTSDLNRSGAGREEVTFSKSKQSTFQKLQIEQERIDTPSQQRIFDLGDEFYDRLQYRLECLQFQDSQLKDLYDNANLVELCKTERLEFKRLDFSENASSQWRTFVRNMETWNRIIHNFEETNQVDDKC